MALEYPHLQFTEGFWWRKPEGQFVRLGITRPAADALMLVTHVELPDAGTVFGSGQPFGVIESQKVVCDLFAPLSGRVIERNPALGQRPFLVNSDPEGEGWLLLVEHLDTGGTAEEGG